MVMNVMYFTDCHQNYIVGVCECDGMGPAVSLYLESNGGTLAQLETLLDL